jgi:hypothetical protein
VYACGYLFIYPHYWLIINKLIFNKKCELLGNPLSLTEILIDRLLFPLKTLFC